MTFSFHHFNFKNVECRRNICRFFVAAFAAEQKDRIDVELNNLWRDGSLENIMACRDLYLRAAAYVISHKFVATAIANEVHRATNLERAKVLVLVYLYIEN